MKCIKVISNYQKILLYEFIILTILAYTRPTAARRLQSE